MLGHDPAVAMADPIVSEAAPLSFQEAMQVAARWLAAWRAETRRAEAQDAEAWCAGDQGTESQDAEAWCARDQGTEAPDVETREASSLAGQLAALLAHHDGRRGFFVVALTSDDPLLDAPPAPVLACLRGAGAAVVDLTVRNLAMSTAILLEHRRNNNEDLANGSLRVQRRCQGLLRQLDPAAVRQRLEQLLEATEGHGPDLAFLERWSYDAAQRQAVAAVVAVTIGNQRQGAAGGRGMRRMSE